MDKVYVVIKVGVYPSDIFGVFEESEIAVDAARTLAANEFDKYHSFDVLEVVFNSLGKINVAEPSEIASGQWCVNKVIFSIKKEGKTKGILEEPLALYGELGGQGHKIVVLEGSAVEVTLDTPEEHSKVEMEPK